ncbi:hypothetical protein [Agromyces sp. NPDC056965]|uniref:hypothetical protein n=1 Tax=Agromyces sp. NPDC056965 TaxID=3345983 RepID=UPI0036278313
MKQGYADQAAARAALVRIQEKLAAKRSSRAMPVRVYPCDRCLGWHTTAKRQKRMAAWDKDPGWDRTSEEIARIDALLRNEVRSQL